MHSHIGNRNTQSFEIFRSLWRKHAIQRAIHQGLPLGTQFLKSSSRSWFLHWPITAHYQTSLDNPPAIMFFTPKPPQTAPCSPPHNRPFHQERPHHPASYLPHSLRGYVIRSSTVRRNAQAKALFVEHHHERVREKWHSR